MLINDDGDAEELGFYATVAEADDEAEWAASEHHLPLFSGRLYLDTETELQRLDKILDIHHKVGLVTQMRYIRLVRLIGEFGEGF